MPAVRREIYMSNEYKDWMNDGGCCGDCIYNVFFGSMATCAMDMWLHKKERCRFFKEELIEGERTMRCGDCDRVETCEEPLAKAKTGRLSDSAQSTGSVDVTLVLSCGTSDCPNHGSHDPNVSGSTACAAITGWCSKWTKPNVKHEPRGSKE